MFSLIKNVKDRKIIGQINSLSEYIEHLKDENREEINIISQLRELDGERTAKYEKLKMGLPCISFNYSYKNEYINNNNALEPSGYLYFDIDNVRDFDFDTKYISALWKSVGGNGFGFLIKVSNLLKGNFKESYEYIATVLDLPYDKACNDISRINFISYDLEVYHNENAEVFDLSEVNTSVKRITKKHPHYSSNKILNYSYYPDGGGIQFTNLKSVLSTYDIKLNEDGYFDFGKDKVQYCKCFVPFNKIVPTGLRNTNLSSYAKCIISINPNADLKSFRHYVHYYNNKYCKPPLPISEVEKMLNNIYNKRGKVDIVNNADKRFLFHESIKCRSEKAKIVGKVLGAEKSAKTIQSLVDVIINWNYDIYPKITQKNLRLVSGRCKNTIEKYYRLVLDIVSEIDENSAN